jgi:hypothetical protein
MVKTIYTDNDSNLEAYVNEANKCFIQIESNDSEDSWIMNQHIVLDELDLEHLIEHLNSILNEMKENSLL